MSHVLLIGFMGSGKSTVGRLLAKRLALPFVDLDKRIEQDSGVTVSELFAAEGEQAFRERERSALEALESEPDSVVACGGGVVVVDANRATLRTLGTVIYLRVSAGEALARIGDTTTRPLLAGPGAGIAATALMQARESLYVAAADIVIDTESKDKAAVVDEVLAALDEVAR